ncbi:MAG: DUF427 domain-containing protein [Phyllobacteriaceae bacterium]|jgi:uncharacterized protein (DUF427 family)|nr:DUF427 domain-containing protein [Phyllobacteriaceae bacterium]
MSETIIRNPDNPDHLAHIRPLGQTVTVSDGGATLARSDAAVIVAEEAPGHGKLPEVIYIPSADVSGLTPVEGKTTHCPLKGDASYLAHDGREVAWTYDRCIEGSDILSGHIAFYANRVTIETQGAA